MAQFIRKFSALLAVMLVLICSLLIKISSAMSQPMALLASQTFPAQSAPVISNVVVSLSNVAPFDKFESHFDVTTVAQNLDLPFEPNPPLGLPIGTGINVDGVFSHDNWTTVITQPAFLEQPYTHTLVSGRDHFTPSGPPHWTVRFAPQQIGNWQYRLRAQDAGGTTFSPVFTFTVSGVSSNPYVQHGFLRVVQRDRRYFEFQDGTPFVGVGYNAGFDSTASVEQKMQLYEQYKMNFMRMWLSGAGINGSQWTSWASHHLSNDGYLPGVLFDTQNTFNGADVAMKLDGTNPCYFMDFWQGGIPVEPDTRYRVTARVKLSSVTGPAGSGAYGFVVKQGGWLGTACDQANQGTLITAPITGTTAWITVTGVYTTAWDQHWLDNLYFVRQNATGGSVAIDEAHVWRDNDPNQIDLLREPNANSHLYFDPMNSAKWDKFIESAQQHGVYLKLVIDEKNEWIKNHLAANGTITTTASNDNFYAAPDTKVRWLQQAWWRYLIARWGYSTAIHSFEYINEGDPYNGHHYEVTNAFARYVHQNDPSQHMVSTSFWSSFPNQEFWSNPIYPDVDYADLHAYISTGWGRDASFLDATRVETRMQYVRSGNASVHITGTDHTDYAIVPRGLVIRGPGEWIIRYWMKASAFTANCSGTGGQQRVHWLVDGGPYWGGTEGFVPNNAQGQYWNCTSPAGTFDWTLFRSDRDRDGNVLTDSLRLILTDTLPHEISLRIENPSGTGGNAWIDDVELVSPSGEVVPVIGQFDITPMDNDTAWFNRAYADLWGGRSPVGAHKPLVRGETGVDFVGNQNWNPALNNDTIGVWLHNNVWGQINPGGMADLMWWAAETIDQNAGTGHYTHIYTNYLTYRNFMADVPLNNGLYRDADALTSDPQLRVWGQRDDANGRMHLWAQNTQHTWQRVVSGTLISPVNGVITLTNMPNAAYQVTWWNTYSATEPIFLTQTIPASGTLSLTLPSPLQDDVGIKIEWAGIYMQKAFLPIMLRQDW